MSKNDDVIVQSSQDVATLVAQLMSATTVLHVSQAESVTLIIRSVEPWYDMPVIAKFAVYKQMHAAEYSLE